MLLVSLRPPVATAQTVGASAAAQPAGRLLTLREAIDRGLTHNLTTITLMHAVGEARGQQQIARSLLMPNVFGEFSASEQQVNLSALGFSPDLPPGFAFPDLSGPFGLLDLRARLTQSVVDLRSLNRYRASGEILRASELSLEDSRDVIVQLVGSAYLDAVATRAKVQASRAQLDTATAIQQRAEQQQRAGLATPIDVNRAHVQTLVEQQRLVAFQADLAKQKINLARMIGLPLADPYELAQELPYAAAPPLTIDGAMQQALEHRSDLKSAEALAQAAERTLASARAERLPSVGVTADYGANRASDKPTYGTYTVLGQVRVPILEGGRTAGSVQQAAATLSRRRAEVDDLRTQIEGDIRKVFIDLETASAQVEVARASLQVSRDTLVLTRQRFEAGLNDNVSVVQAQQSVALAETDVIDSVFAHAMAKLALARLIGSAFEDLAQYLQIP
jgi:outer membrane protein TolC